MAAARELVTAAAAADTSTPTVRAKRVYGSGCRRVQGVRLRDSVIFLSNHKNVKSAGVHHGKTVRRNRQNGKAAILIEGQGLRGKSFRV